SPDTTYSRFSHERLISASDRAAILNWIATGATKGDTTLAPTPPTYSQYQLAGTPDLELTIPTFTSNATTTDSYVCFSMPSGLTQNRIVRAYEIIPGNPSIVHHVIVNADTMGTTTSDLSGTCYTASGDFSLGGYAPGAPPTVFPSIPPLKMGITVKAGSRIVLQIHYPAGTAGQQDSTKVRIYFYPIGTTGIRPVYVTTPLQNWALNIPANTVQTFTSQYPSSGGIPYAISMFSTFPHSHKIATTIVNYAYSGVDTIPFIKINNWDFNWQGYYTFNHMVKVPAGYKLFSKHIYDNTSSNPHNPSSPPVNVHAGVNTNDEMLFDSFQWLVYQPGDENVNVDSLLALDPLLGVSENALNAKNNLRTYAYPNPFENNVNIGYFLDAPSNVTIEIYSIYGTLVKSIQNNFETNGNHEIVWDGKNNSGAKLSNGSYIYIVRAGNNQSYGKLALLGGK
ncbi:MAG: FlgD immunoglobulin-like domain containing protein, partial [Bacteroidia bacterium]